MIHIKINGQEQPMIASTTLSQLLAQLAINPRQVAVAKNLEVIPKGALVDTIVNDGDEIEIFHAVGGG